MLRLSKLADYGSQVMAYMARENAMHSASDVANATGVAMPTVSKILKMLARNNLLQSVRGAKGGYVLSRNPADISIVEIIDAMDGPISITECSTSTCHQESICSTRSNWQDINNLIRDALGSVTLAQMIEPKPQVVNLVRPGIYA